MPDKFPVIPQLTSGIAVSVIPLPEKYWYYSLDESDVLLLGQIERSTCSGEFCFTYVLDADSKLCVMLNAPRRGVAITRPWLTQDAACQRIILVIRVRFSYDGIPSGSNALAMEYLEFSPVTLNGKNVPRRDHGCGGETVPGGKSPCRRVCSKLRNIF